MTLGTNLIVHHGIADILSRAGELICVLGVVQEPHDLASLYEWEETSENIIQFPGRSSTSDRAVASESMGLPYEGLPPLLLVELVLGNRLTQRFCQLFNSRLQQFYRFATLHRLLDRSKHRGRGGVRDELYITMI